MGPKFKKIPQPKQARGAVAAKAQAKLTEAIVLHQQGRLGEAKAIYEAIHKASPQNADALQLLGALAYQTKNYQDAADLIGKARPRGSLL